jgi:hypothetical protein
MIWMASFGLLYCVKGVIFIFVGPGELHTIGSETMFIWIATI